MGVEGWGGERRGIGGGMGFFVRLFDPGMFQEFLDGEALVWVDSEEVGDEVLDGFRDVVPPRGEEGVLAPRDLFGQHLDALVVERGEAA